MVWSGLVMFTFTFSFSFCLSFVWNGSSYPKRIPSLFFPLRVVLNGRWGVENVMYRVLYIEHTMRIDIGDKDRNGDGSR
jgi:hypothetical protein